MTKTKSNPLVVHKHVGGSAGGPGDCSARCSCGVGFYGFDTVGDAITLLRGHIADAPAAFARWRRLVNKIVPRRAKNKMARRSRRINRKAGVR